MSDKSTEPLLESLRSLGRAGLPRWTSMMSLTSGREMDCCPVCTSPSRTGSRVKSLTKWQRPSVELTALEDLKAHGTFDDEAPVALRGRDAQAHAAPEAQVVT